METLLGIGSNPKRAQGQGMVQGRLHAGMGTRFE
jgi:hypothetical protein